MDNFCILIDTREKVNQHLTNIWNKKNIQYKLNKLDSGDYSFEFNQKSFEDKIIIERKASLDELCNNFTKQRERFRREFLRAKDKNTFVVLLIETRIEDIYKHNYRSKMHPNALIGSITSWKEKYNIHVNFIDKKKSAEHILNIFCRYKNKYC